MLVDITIREAMPEDADPISATLIASITQLCTADHGDDPKSIALWIKNKTPDHVLTWISSDRGLLLVALCQDASIASVGAVALDGRILLNYVAPEVRNQGISRLMLKALEARLVAEQVQTATLTSTKTALRFYQAAGWKLTGPAINDFGFPGYPMAKAL